MSLNQWKVLESRYVLEQPPYIRVRCDRCETTGRGQTTEYYVTERRDYAIIVAITADGQVPVVRQYKHGIGQIVCELPAGYIDADEDPTTAALRELKEEAGYIASEARLLAVLWHGPSSSNNRAHCFLLTGLSGPVAQQFDENEEIEVELYPFDQLVDAAARGEMINSNSSNVALLMAAYQLRADPFAKPVRPE